MTSRMTPTEEAVAIDVPEPAGGWGSLKGIASIELSQAAGPGALDTLAHLNKPDGTACTSCAWIKPPTPAALEFCENWAKATLWDLTSARARPDFFKKHTVAASIAASSAILSSSSLPQGWYHLKRDQSVLMKPVLRSSATAVAPQSSCISAIVASEAGSTLSSPNLELMQQWRMRSMQASGLIAMRLAASW